MRILPFQKMLSSHTAIFQMLILLTKNFDFPFVGNPLILPPEFFNYNKLLLIIANFEGQSNDNELFDKYIHFNGQS